MTTRKLGLALLTILATSTSHTAFASPEEAQKIQAAFDVYFGKVPGLVVIAPAGDDYDVTFDLLAISKVAGTAAGTFTSTPFVYRIQSKGNGLWDVTSNSPLNITANVPGLTEFKMAAGEVKFAGTWDENILSFAQSTYSMNKLTMDQSVIDPTSSMKTSSNYVIDSVTGSGTSTDGGNGTANGEGTFDMSGITVNSKMDAPAGSAEAAMAGAMTYTATVAKAKSSSKITGMPVKAVMDAIAYGVSISGKGKPDAAAAAELKTKIAAMMPLFGNLSGTQSYEGMQIQTSMGNFGVAATNVGVDINGFVKEGRGGETFDISGLTLPDGLPLPPWSKGLIPHSFKIGFDVGGFDAETPALKFLQEADLSADQPVPPGSEAAYMAAAFPTNTVKLTIPPGQIASDLYSLSYEGTTDISLGGGLPVVNMKLSMKGMDQIMSALQGAGADPMAQQGSAMVIAAKGLGKAEGDTIVWDVVMGADGKLLVNGTDVSAMAGLGGGG
jgi:hypothetical protein